MSFFHIDKETVLLFIKVIPKARENKISGIKSDHHQQSRLCIHIASCPQKGAANTEIIKFLSGYFKVSLSKIQIVSGKTSRNKKIRMFSTEIGVIERLSLLKNLFKN